MAGDQNHQPHHRLPHELVWEILTWLPVKSLMRFKCVSKIWLSIIMDPSFATAHRGGRRGLLVPTNTRLEQGFRLTNKTYFFYVNLDDDGPNSYSQVISRYLTVNHGGNTGGFTDLVNGLMCFYNRNYSNLFNFATRENLPLPFSNNRSQACSYHFGFDPVNKLYKLLKICPVYDNYDDNSRSAYKCAIFVRHLNCEVLTIGVDSSWRIIDPPPPFQITSRSVCLGGLLYWMELVSDSPDDEKRLISFDLVEEKFQVIPLPGPTRLNGCFSLARFGPGLGIFKVTILPSDNGRETEVLMAVGGGGLWTDEQKFILETSSPQSWLSPFGILPNGKMVIFDDDDDVSSLYLYDQSKRVLEDKIAISLGPPFSPNSFLDLDESLYLEENIIPLNCLATSTTTTTTTN